MSEQETTTAAPAAATPAQEPDEVTRGLELLDLLAKALDRFAVAQERRAAAAERQAATLEAELIRFNDLFRDKIQFDSNRR